MKQLNEQQRLAVLHRDGPCLVLAGPGSGKTTVITERTLQLLKDRPGRGILVITFTRAAAEEMRDRFFKACEKNGWKGTPLPLFGTFHSVFWSILSAKGILRGWRLISPREAAGHLGEIVTEAGLEAQYTTDMQHLLLDRFGRIKNGAEQAEGETKALFLRYQKRLSEQKLLDFDDILIIMENRMRKDRAFLEELQSRFPYLQVDEFQDINPVQGRILSMLAGTARNLFAVGDDDQSIYSFRGSDPSIMLSFQQEYPGCRVIGLELNYRSTPEIVRLSAACIRHNRKRFRKKICSSSPSGEMPECVCFSDEDKEIREVLRILGICEREKRTAAVLYRTRRSASRVIRTVDEAFRCSRYISVMTFHGAKGLEFDTVIIVSALEGVMPHLCTSAEELEEERRMFYVALTRASRHLHIFYTKTSYNQKKRKRSRFIRELCPRTVRFPLIGPGLCSFRKE